MGTQPWSSTAPPGEFRPYVGSEESPREFTLRAIILGALFGVLFGAVSVYVGLRAGLTVSASIPIAVLSISILRAFGRSTILENNIVQTTGSAGESAAAGVIFTMPALIFLGFSLNTEYWRVFYLALLGGTLGVLFMIPLRRQLIVKEHGNLTSPRARRARTCSWRASAADRLPDACFGAWGSGRLHLLHEHAWLVAEPAGHQPGSLPEAPARCTITSEYLGVGYIIGRAWPDAFRGRRDFVAGDDAGDSILGSLAPNAALYPSTMPIPQMSPDELWATYTGRWVPGPSPPSGLITLMTTMPTIVSALSAGLKDVRASRSRCPRPAGRSATSRCAS